MGNRWRYYVTTGILFRNDSVGARGYIKSLTSGDFWIGSTETNGDTVLGIKPDGSTAGNVGIGTTNPTGGKLVVKGTIRAEEVKVENSIAANEFTVKNSAWSDFVFKDNYNLPTLDTVESYIKENKHLPDIPSAKQVEEEGLSVSEMLSKQMIKIEELTLYMIEQGKQLSALKKKNEEIKRELAELKKIVN